MADCGGRDESDPRKDAVPWRKRSFLCDVKRCAPGPTVCGAGMGGFSVSMRGPRLTLVQISHNGAVMQVPCKSVKTSQRSSQPKGLQL